MRRFVVALSVGIVMSVACARTRPTHAVVAGPVAAQPTAAASNEGNARDDLIPRGVLFGDYERTDVQVSPDGKWLSWLAPNAGVLNVYGGADRRARAGHPGHGRHHAAGSPPFLGPRRQASSLSAEDVAAGRGW